MNNLPRTQRKWGVSSLKYLERIKVETFSGNGTVLEENLIRVYEEWRQRGEKVNGWWY